MSTPRPRLLAVGVLSCLMALTTLGLRAGPALATAGTSQTTVIVDSTIEYGQPLGLYARVKDVSDSCLNLGTLGCDRPQGRVDFYAVVGQAQTFLGSGNLVPYSIGDLLTDDTSETDPFLDLNYCCLEPGTYTVRAYYVPGDFDPSSADSDPLTVTKGGSTTTMTASTSSAAFGDTVTFHLHAVSSVGDARAAVPTGSIDVREGTTSYGTGILDANGDATVTSSSIPAGSHSLHAAYSGDSRYQLSSSDSLGLTVTAGTQSSLGASSTSPTYGDSITLTDTVGMVAPATGTPTGTVTFLDGASSIGTDSLDEGSPDTATLTTDALGAGSHTLSASYAGGDGFGASTSNSVTINVAKADTTTSLGSSANPVTFGQPVTFTATVSGPGTTTPSGTVQFRDGATALGAPQTVIAGVASLTIGSLAGGSHAISAVYSGSSNYNGSTSNTISQSVTCDQTITGSVSSITVTSGSTCLSGAKLSGNVTVSGSGSLSVVNSTISGGITVTGQAAASIATAPAVTVCGSTVAGNVLVTGVSGFVLLGDVPDDACAGNWFKGSVTLSGNTGGLALADNRIGGFVKVTNNVGAGPSPDHEAPIVAANVIGGYVVISGNSPAATDDGRPNHLKKGQLVAI